MEYDGKLPPQEANRLALLDTLRCMELERTAARDDQAA